MVLILIGAYFYFASVYDNSNNKVNTNNVSKLIKFNKKCISSDKLKNFDSYENKNISFYIPKTWILSKLEGFDNNNAKIFALPSSNYEMFFYWRHGYTNTEEQLAKDTFKNFKNVKILKQDKIKQNYVFTHYLITYNLNDKMMYQDIYTYIDNKHVGYVLFLKTFSTNYPKNYKLLKPILCSFRIK